MASKQEERDRDRGQSKWVWLTPLALIAVLVILYFVWPAFHSFINDAYDVLSSGNQQRVQEWIDGFGAWSYVVVIGLMLMQTILAFLPSVVLMVVAVISFGPVAGGLLAWGGMLLAATLGYVIGRSFGVVTIDRLVGSKTERKMENIVKRYGIWAVIAARISPVLSTDAVSIAAGLGGMKYLHFIFATAVGTLPLAVLIAWLGRDFSRLGTGLIWISVASVAAFAAYVGFDRWKRLKSGG